MIRATRSRRHAITAAIILALMLAATETLALTPAASPHPPAPTAAPSVPPVPTPTPHPTAGEYSAVWAWHSPHDPPDVTDLITHARTAGLHEIYVAVPWDVATHTAYVHWLTRLRDTAARHDITLSALGGDPDWPDNPDLARTWMTGAMRTGAFTRIHLDVEPWARPDWATRSEHLATAYLDMLNVLRAVPDAPPIDVDLFAFLADQRTTDGQVWLTQVLSRVDGISILAFRDHATGSGNGILDISAPLRAAAQAANVPYRVGVETNPNPECPTCTFHGKGPASLRSQVSAVHTALTGMPGYAGIAVEDYRNWVRLDTATPPRTAIPPIPHP